jgi:ATP-dependent helicase/nuclease subunit A
VQWREDGAIEVSLRKRLETQAIDRLADLEAEMDLHEKQRLLYVAVTRAQDHLLVSAHHAAGRKSFGATLWECSEPHLDVFARRFDRATAPPPTAPGAPGAPVEDGAAVLAARQQWIEQREALLRTRNRDVTISATAVARADAGPDAAGDPGLSGPADEARADLADGTTDEDALEVLRWRRGRAGTALGRAVHSVLELVDFDDEAAVDALVRGAVAVEGVPEREEEVARRVRSVLATDLVRDAAGRRHWRESYVAVPVGEQLLEGYVDLLVETDDGLLVVDYKTDAVRSEADIDERLDHYRLQGACYALAVAGATGRPVTGCAFVFAGERAATVRWIDDLPGAVAEVEARLANAV